MPFDSPATRDAVRRRALVAVVSLLLVVVIPPPGAADSMSTGDPMPSGRAFSTTVWTGSLAYIYGGTGAGASPILAYDPVLGTVTSTGLDAGPGARHGAAAVWNGSASLIFGGDDSPARIAIHDPTNGTITSANAVLPVGVSRATAVWTGTRAYIFGGYNITAEGAMATIQRYDPATDTADLVYGSLPYGVLDATAVWTGTHAYIFGGAETFGWPLNTTMRFDPFYDSVVTMNEPIPSGIARASSMWDGQYAYLFGGTAGNFTETDQVLRYDPNSDSYLSMSAKLPTARDRTSAVWTGTEGLIVGGWLDGSLDDIVHYSLAPGAPKATVSASGPREITISWMAVPVNSYSRDIGGFLVYAGLAGGPLSIVANVSHETTSYVDSGLVTGDVREYAVRAYNPQGLGAASSGTATVIDVPGAVDQFQVVAAGWGDALLTWNLGSTGGRPVVEHLISINGAAYVGLNGTRTTYHENGFVPGDPLTFEVEAINSVGTGPAATVTFTPAGPAGAPTQLSATPGPGMGDVTLQWTPPAHSGWTSITGYTIQRIHGGMVTDLGMTFNETFVDRGLPPGAIVEYQVATLNVGGAGAWSDVAVAQTFARPGAPTDVTLTRAGNAVQIAWSAPQSDGRTPISAYRIYRGDGAGEGALIATVGGGARAHTDNNPGTGVRVYTVSAVNLVGEGPRSDSASIVTAATNPLAGLTDTQKECVIRTADGWACTPGSSSPVLQVAAGARHTCALLQNGKVDCWGDNSQGQSADHTTGQAVAVSAGGSHTCVLLSTGGVDCYGGNAWGKATSYTGTDARQVSAGGTHTCFLKAGGVATCQGSNAFGQSPSWVSSVSAISTGRAHTCMLTTAGSVTCFGENSDGQSEGRTSTDALAVVAGDSHSCALLTGSRVACWGATPSPPESVQGRVLALAAGGAHTCARLSGGNVECWGSNRDGQSASYSEGNASSITAGDSHTCVRRSDLTISCWGHPGVGRDFGQAESYP